MNKKEAIIVWLIICVFFTPILACAGIKGLGGLLSLWLGFVFIWYIFYGKDMIELSKYKKECEERVKENKRERDAYETSLPILYKEREEQRRTKNMVTDSSFKEYMNRLGFTVEGSIDIGDLPDWTQYHYGYSVKPYKKPLPSNLKIITHKSYDELKQMGIYDVKQLLGDYFKYFSFSIGNNYGGFYKEKKIAYDLRFNPITVDDSNNMCADVTFRSELDNNVNVKWSKDYIYCIIREPTVKIIDKYNTDELKKWIPESLIDVNLNAPGNTAKIVYNKFIIYRDSGVVVKDGNASLTNNEKEFIILARKENSGVIKCGEYYRINNMFLCNIKLV